MRTEKVDTFWARIYMAGDLDVAKQVCRDYCELGLCVNIYETDYIYTQGEEAGFCIELINYPRFPSTPDVILAHADALAEKLLLICHQSSYSIMTSTETYWYSRRAE